LEYQGSRSCALVENDVKKVDEKVRNLKTGVRISKGFPVEFPWYLESDVFPQEKGKPHNKL
jgi:hypothetical protein